MNTKTYVVSLHSGKEFTVKSDCYSPTNEFCPFSHATILRFGGDAQFRFSDVAAVIRQPDPQPTN